MEKYELKELVPSVYDEVLEMDELINTEQKIFDELYEESEQVQNNAFLISADSSRIRDYEKLLKIKANTNIEDLQFRRGRVINRLSTRPPFTISWLKEKLTQVIGANNWKLTIMPEEYLIYIKVREMSDNWEGELRETLSKVIPVNVEWTLVENPYTTYGELKSAEYTYGELEQYTHAQITNL